MKPKLRRILHRLFFGVVALTTLVVLFYAEEDWRGARAWLAVRRDLQARGESLDLRDFIPPPVPDDQNLAMAPLFVRAFRYKVDPDTGLLTFDLSGLAEHHAEYPDFWTLAKMPYGRRDENINAPPQHGSWNTGHPLDLAAWQALYQDYDDFPHPPQPGTPPEDVLLALTRYGPLLDELAQSAAERPLARWPVDYTKRPSYSIPGSHTSLVQRLERTLRLRACARLALGQTEAARRDMELLFQLNESLNAEPMLFASLVRAEGLSIFLQPLWEGLAARKWTADDLEAFQTKLHHVNMLRVFQLGVRGGERATFQAQLPDDLQHWGIAREMQRIFPDFESIPDDEATRWLWRFLPILPRGWYLQNATLASRFLQAGLIDAVDPDKNRVTRANSTDMGRTLADLPVTPYNFLAKIQTSGYFRGITISFVRAQIFDDQAMAACALEKYYLDHHAYPAALAALVPGYLDRVPNDVIDGAPMRYRLTVDGRYQLYSIGWDGQDDGGAIDWPPDRKWRRAGGGIPVGQEQPFPSPSRDQGDWVWQYAPAEPPEPPDNRSRLESLP